MEKLIVGTLPPPRFSTGALKAGDVHFCYGSKDGLLWPILDRIFDLGLVYEDSQYAITQREHFLKSRKIGVCDIVSKAYRTKIDASDLGMQKAELRDVLGVLREYQSIKRILFTGGNSKNGPEYFFRKQLKLAGNNLEVVSNDIPRIHRFTLDDRVVETVSLTAPSGSANRAIGSMAAYKKAKALDSNFNTLDFRVDQYRPYF
ncbi:uracil-DNA glycosylase family protein [Sediminicola luteus]|nr:uracil-DNA glycosylase family protein [Sediminicola luteus]